MSSHSSASSPFNVTPADEDRYLQAITRLTAGVFYDGRFADEIGQYYIGNSHYNWETSRLVWDGGHLLHHWGVWGYLMHLETAQLKVAGIGAVCTDESFRRQGLMNMAAAASFDSDSTPPLSGVHRRHGRVEVLCTE